MAFLTKDRDYSLIKGLGEAVIDDISGIVVMI